MHFPVASEAEVPLNWAADLGEMVEAYEVDFSAAGSLPGASAAGGQGGARWLPLKYVRKRTGLSAERELCGDALFRSFQHRGPDGREVGRRRTGPQR